jgi:hypothetical protein
MSGDGGAVHSPIISRRLFDSMNVCGDVSAIAACRTHSSPRVALPGRVDLQMTSSPGRPSARIDITTPRAGVDGGGGAPRIQLGSSA